MTTVVTHRIRRLRWRLDAQSRPEAFDLRASWRAAVEATLLPEVERAFDDLPLGNDVLRIDRLELAVRVSGPAPNPAALQVRLRAALREQITHLLPPTTTSQNAPSVRPADATTDRVGSAAYQRSALLEYLQTGSVTWDLNINNCAGGLWTDLTPTNSVRLYA